ncbi:hypothetical protein Tco_1023073, partial [Tanacetum coccineum]
GNLTKGVDLEAEWLNAISERLSERLCKKARSRTSMGSEPREVSKLVGALELVGALRKEKVMRWMFKGMKAFSLVNLNEYVRVASLKGLLIVRKEGLACVQILYGWIRKTLETFDEALLSFYTESDKGLLRYAAASTSAGTSDWGPPSSRHK